MSDSPDPAPGVEPEAEIAAAPEAEPGDELDRIADAITALAGARHRIELPRLLRDTALNVLIISRIASNRLPEEFRLRKEEIESAADNLVTQLRHAARELPPPSPVASAFPEQAPAASVDTAPEAEPETYATAPAPEL